MAEFKYSIQDAREGKSPAAWVQWMNCAGKALGISQAALVGMIYRQVDVELRVNIDTPSDDTTITELIKCMESKLELWKELFTTRSQRYKEDLDHGAQRCLRRASPRHHGLDPKIYSRKVSMSYIAMAMDAITLDRLA